MRASRIATGLVCALLAILGAPASAQDRSATPLDRPGSRPVRPDTSPIAPGESLEQTERPPASPPARDPPVPGTSVRVDAIRLRGNTVIADERLLEAARPWLGRRLGPSDLQQLLVDLTRIYVDAGYVNSGAVLPNQTVDDGTLRIELVEGRIGTISVEGTRAYRESTLVRRLRSRLDPPLRVDAVEEALRLLERDPRIRRLDARLRPTERRGVAALIVRIEEEGAFRTEFGVDNDTPPSVGTLGGRVLIGHDNPLGLGDRFVSEGHFTEGLWRVGLAYETPVHPSGTLIGVETRISQAEVVQPPFDVADVESEARSYALRLEQPLFQSLRSEVVVGLVAEHRRGRTSILDRGFPISPGTEDGRTRLTALRPSLAWVGRSERAALALRSITSFGLDLPSSTKGPSNLPDGRYVSWLGQARGVFRVGESGLEWHGRLDVQLASDPLLPLEQLPLGGAGSVRGYRRNAVVRDQGLVGSVELRWPLLRVRGRRWLELTPFVDAGHAWNRDRSRRSRRTLASMGLGLRWHPIEPFGLEIEWGMPLMQEPRGDSLQGRGLRIAARWSFR